MGTLWVAIANLLVTRGLDSLGRRLDSVYQLRCGLDYQHIVNVSITIQGGDMKILHNFKHP